MPGHRCREKISPAAYADVEPSGEALKAMLNERQTLSILGWTVGSVCIAIFALSALAMA